MGRIRLRGAAALAGILIMVGGCKESTAVEHTPEAILRPRLLITDSLGQFFASVRVGADPGDQVITQPNNLIFTDNSSGFWYTQGIIQIQENQNLMVGAAGNVILAPNGEDLGGLVEFTTPPTDQGTHLATQYYLPIRVNGVVRYLRLYT